MSAASPQMGAVTQITPDRRRFRRRLPQLLDNPHTSCPQQPLSRELTRLPAQLLSVPERKLGTNKHVWKRLDSVCVLGCFTAGVSIIGQLYVQYWNFLRIQCWRERSVVVRAVDGRRAYRSGEIGSNHVGRGMVPAEYPFIHASVGPTCKYRFLNKPSGCCA